MLDGGTKPWAGASSPLQHPGPLCVFPTRCTPQGAAVEAGHLSLQPHLADCSAVGISPELGPQAPPLWSRSREGGVASSVSAWAELWEQ